MHSPPRSGRVAKGDTLSMLASHSTTAAESGKWTAGLQGC